MKRYHVYFYGADNCCDYSEYFEALDEADLFAKTECFALTFLNHQGYEISGMNFYVVDDCYKRRVNIKNSKANESDVIPNVQQY